jgi:hypothetical protein
MAIRMTEKLFSRIVWLVVALSITSAVAAQSPDARYPIIRDVSFENDLARFVWEPGVYGYVDKTGRAVWTSQSKHEWL